MVQKTNKCKVYNQTCITLNVKIVKNSRFLMNFVQISNFFKVYWPKLSKSSFFLSAF